MKSVQETHSPNGSCFGCGPKNEKGLRIRSFDDGEDLVCTWRPEPHHQAFEGILNGGICGALLAQGLSVEDTARTAVYAHGLAGDLAAKKTGQLGLTASDVMESLGDVWRRWGR